MSPEWDETRGTRGSVARRGIEQARASGAKRYHHRHSIIPCDSFPYPVAFMTAALPPPERPSLNLGPALVSTLPGLLLRPTWSQGINARSGTADRQI